MAWLFQGASIPDYCTDEVADTTWPLLLAVIRQIRLADRQVQRAVVAGGLLPMHRCAAS